MRWTRTLVIVLLLTGGTADAVTLEGNEAPLADAGLDQQATRGSTVLLDATGSTDPDGAIAAYEWTIRTPDGRTTVPDCASCGRTEFVPRRTGEYAVSVRVTDDDGATRTDTLYVTVENGSTVVGPAVTLTGPTRPPVDTPATYTATATAGDAPLDTLTWQVGAGPARTRTVSGSTATEELTRVFRSTSADSVRVTVRDTAGRTDTATLPVNPRSVRQPIPSTTGDPTSGSLPAVDPARSPIIEGPQLVLGRSLEATYSVRPGSAANVTGIQWFADRIRRGSGRQTTVDWAPGDHHLFAVVEYESGPDAIATFEDGSRNVTADPRPEISVTPTLSANGISGNATGSDAYGNLRSVRVYLDGEQVDGSTTRATPKSRDVTSAKTAFSASGVEAGQHNLTVVARDARGQAARETIPINATGLPEVVFSGFVNAPVDSFHPRINASRYTGHHVLKLQLNGVDPEDVSVEYRGADRVDAVRLNESRWGDVYNPDNDTITYHSLWGSRTADDIQITSRWESGQVAVSTIGTSRDVLDVENSPPEIRTSYPHDGTETTNSTNHERTHPGDAGILIDACDSFDPDNSSLTYRWYRLSDDTAVTGDCTYEANSTEIVNLKVIDGQQQDQSKQLKFHHYYVPELRASSPETSQGGDYATVRVTTEPYSFTKSRYDATLGIRTNYSDIEVVNWSHDRITKEDLNDELGSGLSSSRLGAERYEGYLRVPKAALSVDTPPVKVTLFNINYSRTATRSIVLDPIHSGNQTQIRNVSVSAHYIVQTQDTSRLTVQTRDAVQSRSEDGYRVVEKRNTGTKYFIEKYTKVANATYETRTEAFATRHQRDLFMESGLDWRAAGKRTYTETETVTKTEWRDRRGGTGTFTGETRNVLVHDARYRTEYQYERDRTVTRTRTEYDIRCRIGFCVPIVRTTTYTTTVTDTYWARHNLRGGDPTGRSRRTLIESAEYKTQYQYEYETTRKQTYTEYLASKEVQTAPAEYEWVDFMTTQQRSTAVYYDKLSEKYSSSETEYRISETESSPEWIMVRTNGTETTKVAQPDPSDTVLETRATFDGTVEVVSNSTGEIMKIVPFEFDFSEKSRLSESELLRIFEEEIKKRAIRNAGYQGGDST
ncbi:PKD domain-containing protein [Natronomonas sp. EA1]|uniref:PKD domain-containing protein n=1 Tax=Natronomonas sp. EA1 TaxID=3421655 RepID=UPI003EB8DDC6